MTASQYKVKNIMTHKLKQNQTFDGEKMTIGVTSYLGLLGTLEFATTGLVA